MRIVHLSDLHMRYHLGGASGIPERRSRGVAALLRTATPTIRDLAPDLIVLSGDLLEFPRSDADSRHPFDPIPGARRDLVYLRRWLEELAVPHVVIPGNHDDMALVEEVFHPSGTRDLGGYRLVTFHDPEDADHVPHRTGRQRERFEQVLADPTSPPQIHLQHYLIWPPYRDGYPYAYADAEALAEQIVGSGNVRLVLSGHYHEGVPPLRLGDTWFAAAPAFCEPPYIFWAYDLAEDVLQHSAYHLAPKPGSHA